MKERLTSSNNTDYDILLNDDIIISKRNAACFREFFSFQGQKYNKIRIYNMDCKPTVDYKDFYVNYVIEMFDLQNTNLTNDYFEFQTTGEKHKDLVVMTVVRLLWEYICGNSNINSIESLFKPLQEGKSRYKDKLKRFCHFYSKIGKEQQYMSEGHCPLPKKVIIKSTEDFKKVKNLKTVNEFFYK